MTTENESATSASPTSGIRNALELFGLVIAPATAISSVLLYFGWTRQNAIYGYFGVDHSVLRLSPQDYLLRSTGVIFKPLAIILGFLALLLIISRLLDSCAERAARWLLPLGRRRKLPALPAAQLLLTALFLGTGVGALLGRWDALTGAISLALGSLMASGFAKSRATEPRQAFWSRVLVGSVIGFSIFWATTVYAVRSGTSLAQYINQYPTAQPATTVHSATQLDFPNGFVTETKIQGQDGRFRYKYTGLRLLAYANDRWVLIVGRESDRKRVTISLLKDSDAIRVELVGH